MRRRRRTTRSSSSSKRIRRAAMPATLSPVPTVRSTRLTRRPSPSVSRWRWCSTGSTTSASRGGSGRSRIAAMSLRGAWDEQAHNWIGWTRNSLDDTFYRFHGDRFFELLPPPGRLTVDLGAGEGRVARALRALGHTVVEVEASARLAAASIALSGQPVVVGDVSCLPLRSGIADVAIAFMSFQDVD